MLFVLSPAKTLDYDSPIPPVEATLPGFVDRSAELIDVLQRYSPADVSGLMGISDALAQLNVARFASWSPQADERNARPAVFAFNGDVYDGLEASTLDGAAIGYLQARLRILSGLYGLLRPLDLLQPYRLEMGTRLQTPRGKNLYEFWGDSITNRLQADIDAQGACALINLASEEYFKAVRPGLLEVPVITPVFEDWKSGTYKIISFYAKQARGSMARFAAVNGISHPEQLQAFAEDGYAFAPEASTPTKWVFRRRTNA